MMSDKPQFPICEQKHRFCDDVNNPVAEIGVQRKCLAENYNTLLKTSDEQCLSFSLEKDLGDYYDLVDQKLDSSTNRNNDPVKNILSKHNIQIPKLKSKLSKLDMKTVVTPLNCAKDGLFCSKSENVSTADFKQCMELFRRNKNDDNVPKKAVKSFSLQTTNNNNNKDQKFSRSNSDEINTMKPSTSFKTALEELHIQNSKKCASNEGVHQPTSSLYTRGQKRTLGMRRNVNSKFVPPTLSRTDSTKESPKSEEWPAELDERLKNIDPKMIELIKSEIMDVEATVEWNDIVGLEFAKNSIQEAVVWPMLRPDIFTGLRRPPKGILLFGPPGTGKTLIGKCVASQSKSTFFSISASSLTSKWVGDGEKMVRALFSVARCYQPAVIFIDEIDSLLSQRSDTEHESSRRIKTEFLVQLDGATTNNEERLLLIGATNRPQELDEAARRRFVKRLYIPLPEHEARLQLVMKLISKENHSLTHEHYEEIAKLSSGYSGADIRSLCSEAALGPIRSIDMGMIETIQAEDVRSLNVDDFYKAFNRVRTSVSSKDLDQYVLWDRTYGSGL